MPRVAPAARLRRLRRAALVFGPAAAAAVLLPSTLLGQEPPDSVPPPDTLVVVPDSAVVPIFDSVAADTAAVDTVFYTMPDFQGGVAAGWERGVWEWDGEDILSVGANTLVELMAEVPGMVPVRGGDYGTPLGLTAFGLGAEGIRIVRDGFELPPMGGGSVDLARIGLGGIERVRLERSAGGLLITMESRRNDRPQPFSLIEAGTGDLDTNIFRGTFVDPSALGGSVAVALERTDTRGPRGDEPGNRMGSWLRYQLHRGDDLGFAIDFRRMGRETEVSDYPSPTTRTDWVVRARARLTPDITTEAYWGRSSYTVDDIRDVYLTEGGSRSQMGLRAEWARSGLFARGAVRRFGGDAFPSSSADLSLGGVLPGVAGAAVDLERASWGGQGTSATLLRGWTEPRFGFSAFASRSAGTRAARVGPLQEADVPDSLQAPADSTAPADPVVNDLPDFRTVDRTTTRYGAQFGWRGVLLSAARLRLEADSLLPLGLEFDRAGPALPGGTRSGWEWFGRLPLPVLDGLHVEGSLQQWDPLGQTVADTLAEEPGDALTGWSYLPDRIYRGAFVFHRTLVASGNAELWVHLGVRGRDPMTVRQVVAEERDPDSGALLSRELGQVPFYQSWYGTIQFRVVTVRIFVGWENFTVRRNLQDVPGRVLPRTRAVYGIRWTMLN